MQWCGKGLEATQPRKGGHEVPCLRNPKGKGSGSAHQSTESGCPWVPPVSFPEGSVLGQRIQKGVQQSLGCPLGHTPT